MMALQHHQKAVRRALVKLQGGGYLSQAERSFALAE
jgi:hypothetical protein